MDQNCLNNFGRGPPKDRFGKGFRRSCRLSQKLTDGRRVKTGHKSSPCHFVTGELKSMSSKLSSQHPISATISPPGKCHLDNISLACRYTVTRIYVLTEILISFGVYIHLYSYPGYGMFFSCFQFVSVND